MTSQAGLKHVIAAARVKESQCAIFIEWPDNACFQNIGTHTRFAHVGDVTCKRCELRHDLFLVRKFRVI